MDKATFDAFKKRFFEDMDELLQSKGDDYSPTTDRLGHFKVGGKRSGITPLQHWHAMFNKHLMAIESYVQKGRLESEPLRSRFIDAANYLLLGAALAASTARRGESTQPEIDPEDIGAS